MNTVKKNQHFVPKFYLRNFSYESNLKEIGIYNTRNNVFVQRAKLKTQGSRNFFYGADGIIEGELQSIEGDLARVLKHILSQSQEIKLSADEYYILLFFIVLTEARNPSRINGFADMMGEMRKKIFEEYPNTDLDKVLPLPTHEQCVRLSLSNCRMMVDGISDLKYRIVENLTDIPFISSDDPVVKYNQFLEWKKWRHSRTGYGSIGLQIFLPLSYRRMLFLFDSNIYKIGGSKEIPYTLKNYDDVDQLNLLQFCNCIENLFFDEKGDKHYILDLARRGAEFPKANIPFTNLANIEGPGIEPPFDPAKGNLAINGTTECEIGLKITGLRFSDSAKFRKLLKTVAQPRPGSSVYDELLR